MRPFGGLRPFVPNFIKGAQFGSYGVMRPFGGLRLCAPGAEDVARIMEVTE